MMAIETSGREYYSKIRARNERLSMLSTLFIVNGLTEEQTEEFRRDFPREWAGHNEARGKTAKAKELAALIAECRAPVAPGVGVVTMLHRQQLLMIAILEKLP